MFDVEILRDYLPENLDFMSILKLALVFVVASLVLGLIGRLIFGKKSVLNQSTSSAIGIIFIYIITIFIHGFGLDLKFLLSPLPFLSIGEPANVVSLYVPINDPLLLCGELMNLVVLAFLTNLANKIIPQGKKLVSWLLFRVLSVSISMVLFSLVNNLLTAYLPDSLVTWSPVILLGVTVLTMILGAIKRLIGAALTTVNPLIALLYKFFFVTLIGKMISKAVLTTALVTGLFYALNQFGIVSLVITSSFFFLPLIIVLLVIWFLLGKVL